MAAFPSADKAVGTLPKADGMPRLVGPTSLRHSTASGWFTLDRKTIEWPAIVRPSAATAGAALPKGAGVGSKPNGVKAAAGAALPAQRPKASNPGRGEATRE